MNNPAPTEFDEYADIYEEALKQSMPAAFAENEYFAEYKIDHIGEQLNLMRPKKFLDFGCGIGRSLSIVNKRYPHMELWGYDVSQQSIEVARQRTKNVFFSSNINDFSAETFDVIFAANVFHHIPIAERLEALAKCTYMLSPRGRIFLFEHNPFNPLTRLVFERCIYDKDATMLKKQEVLQMANKVGLNIVNANYTLFFPRQLAWLRPLEKLLGWLPLGAQYCIEMTKG